MQEKESIMNVTLCKHSETVAPFACLVTSRNDQKLKEFKRDTPLKILEIAGK